MKLIEKALERARAEEKGEGAGEPRAMARLEAQIHPTPLPSPERPRPMLGSGRSVLHPRRAKVLRLAPEVVERNRLKIGNEADATAQAYRVLRTRALQWLDVHGRSTVAMISASDGDGKTLSAVNLALSIANDTNHTALLVDFDLRAPSLHERLGLDVERGVEAFFSGAAAIEDLIVSVCHPRLAVLPCLAPVQNSSDVLSSRVVRELVAQLKSRYADRIVLFDLPPALAGDDAIAFLPLVDAALLVIGEGATRREQLERLSTVLAGTPVIGSILNRAARTIDPYYG